MLRVYRKESKKEFKSEHPFWYSATNSKGISLNIIFDKSIIDEVPDKPAFTITNIVGNAKFFETTNEETGEVYNNGKYYVKSCDFGDMPVEQLDE